MPIFAWWIAGGLAGAGTFKLLASGAQDAGEAVDNAGSGILKLAIAGGVGYFVLKKGKVI